MHQVIIAQCQGSLIHVYTLVYKLLYHFKLRMLMLNEQQSKIQKSLKWVKECFDHTQM